MVSLVAKRSYTNRNSATLFNHAQHRQDAVPPEDRGFKEEQRELTAYCS